MRASNFKHLISVVLENKISFASLRWYEINRQLIGCCLLLIVIARQLFLATLVALHFTPVSESVSQWAEFRTSVAPRLASLF